MNPKEPQIHGIIKLHEQGKPVRPIGNWKEQQGYKLAKHLHTILNNAIQLPNAFNILISNNLINTIKTPQYTTIHDYVRSMS
jgi:sugar (pentulose or hexulose) kinase